VGSPTTTTTSGTDGTPGHHIVDLGRAQRVNICRVAAVVVRNRLRSVSVPPVGGPGDPLAVHLRLPGYAPSPVHDVPVLAGALGLGRVLVKDESSRMGLPAFKILGASWATYRALVDRLGAEPAWASIEQLAEAVARLRPLRLAAATDGNQGRAVARTARWLDLDATVLVPAGTVEARIAAIASEGAEVVVVDGTYDDAVAASAALASSRCLVISDTSWPGYEDVPADVIAGYSTIFAEAATQVTGPVDAWFVPVGVGALAAAAVRACRGASGGGPTLVSVEPSSASCVQASIVAGRLVSVPGPHPSIMVGLNCGDPSPLAWPAVSAGFDWFVAVDDDDARDAMRALASVGVVAGETGAAALAGLTAAGAATFALGPSSTVGVLMTEGATDPAGYEAIVGRRPRA
jgi:diaminopropionate ammonia-lyase